MIQRNGKISHPLEGISIVKMVILPKQSIDLMQALSEYP